MIAYRELRLLELEILRASRFMTQGELNIHSLLHLNVDQFYGIEIEEFPAQIAQVALWLMDHQMNLLVSEEFGLYFVRIPLQTSSTIVCGNALTIDWKTVVSPWSVSYIMGNPPFVGAKFMNDDQRKDVALVFDGIKNAGLLDFVAAWYVKAVRFMKGESIRCAFVSTNSITQGEQVGVLWSWMLDQGMKIFFAHRTFQWNNEARGKAAVHCVIIGFAETDISPKWIFEYENIKGEPHQIKAQNINPYLVDAPNLVLTNRSAPICSMPRIGIGNKPIDDGNYLFTEEEMRAFLAGEPQAKSYFRRWLGADEFLNGYYRYCLWLGDCPPSELKKMPEALKRVEAVKKFRLASKSPPTRKLAETPTRFHVENIPAEDYILISRVSSERRLYLPVGHIDFNDLTSDSALILVGAKFYHFGIISSLMHNAWMRTVCGRLESRYRYSAGIVYNNFPWPENPTDKQKQAIEDAAQGVLDARAQFPGSSLADLYDPLTMPPLLLKAHQTLDRAVDAAYGKTNFKTEAERVAFLFELYQKYTSLFAPEKPKRRKKGMTLS